MSIEAIAAIDSPLTFQATAAAAPQRTGDAFSAVLGAIVAQPLVMRDNSELFERARKIRWLESGESLTLRANLKRFHFNEGHRWQPGEYSAKATFGLCEQTPGDYDDPAGAETPGSG